jgi:hypothetical protein
VADRASPRGTGFGSTFLLIGCLYNYVCVLLFCLHGSSGCTLEYELRGCPANVSAVHPLEGGDVAFSDETPGMRLLAPSGDHL